MNRVEDGHCRHGGTELCGWLDEASGDAIAIVDPHGEKGAASIKLAMIEAWECKARGADPTRRDTDHEGTPLDWSRHRHAFVGDRWGHAAVERLLEPLMRPRDN